MKTTLKIPWSIHQCVKFYQSKPKKKGGPVSGGSQMGYMTVRLEGKKKVKKMHDTLGSALKEVRLCGATASSNLPA